MFFPFFHLHVYARAFKFYRTAIVRNDEKKEAPCLVPYEELPEIEKAYNRDTAFNTLKYIVSLGFKIIK